MYTGYLLAGAYVLHWLSIIIWMGIYVSQLLLIGPSLKNVSTPDKIKIQVEILARCPLLIITAIVVFVITGLIQIRFLYGFEYTFRHSIFNIKLFFVIVLIANTLREMAFHKKFHSLMLGSEQHGSNTYAQFNRQWQQVIWLQVALFILILFISALLRIGYWDL